MNDGTVRCWGSNVHGHLGYGHTTNIGDNEEPVSAGVVDVGGTVVQLATGYYHNCALLDTGKVRCWGWNSRGQLGYGHTDKIGDDEAPSVAGDVDIGGDVKQICSGLYHNCVILVDDTVRCWGYNNLGQLGYGNTTDIGDDEVPATVGAVNIGATATQIACAGYRTCVVTDNQTVRCWGDGSSGQLGYGNTQNIGDNELPSAAGEVSLGQPVTAIGLGGFHNCALLTDDTVRCWGSGSFGQLGYGNTQTIGDNELPSAVGPVNVGGVVTALEPDGQYTCARLEDSAVRCWGRSDTGQLGYGNTQTIGDNESPASAGDVQFLP